MSPTSLGIALLAAMLLLRAMRVPSALAMLIPGLAGGWWLAGDGGLGRLLEGLAFSRHGVEGWLLIPLFLLMGQVALEAGWGGLMLRSALAALGSRPGRVSMAALVAGAGLGSLGAPAVSSAVSLSRAAGPLLQRRHVSMGLGHASLAAAVALGTLLPPSVPLLVVALVGHLDPAQLFRAAWLPALLGLAAQGLAVAAASRHEPASSPSTTVFTGFTAFGAFGAVAAPDGGTHRAPRVAPILAVAGAVHLGLVLGGFEPVLAACLGVLACIALARWRRELPPGALSRCLRTAAKSAVGVFLLLLGADLLSTALALAGLPEALARGLAEWELAPLSIVALALLFSLLLGWLLNGLAMLMLVLPLLMPWLASVEWLGLSVAAKGLWFGVMLVAVVGIGQLMPPLGVLPHVVARVLGESPLGRADSAKAALPFVLAACLWLLVLLAFPMLSLAWVVRT